MVVMTRRFVQMTIVIPLNACVTTVGFTNPLCCNDQHVLWLVTVFMSDAVFW